MFPDIASQYRDGKSIKRLARETGEPYSRVRRELMNLGVRLRTYEEAGLLAADRIAAALRGRKRAVVSQ